MKLEQQDAEEEEDEERLQERESEEDEEEDGEELEHQVSNIISFNTVFLCAQFWNTIGGGRGAGGGHLNSKISQYQGQSQFRS